MAKNAVVANVARGNRRQHFGPNGGMQTFVLFDLVRLQAYDLSNPAHSYLLSSVDPGRPRIGEPRSCHSRGGGLSPGLGRAIVGAAACHRPAGLSPPWA